ncbi:MAG: replication-relaxation family protein [Planctomycetales bacterium]
MRYATADQLQRKFPQWLTSPRTARRHLANLTDAGHLATESIRSTSPYFPLVYFATRKGTRLVEAAYAERGIEWESGGVEQRRSRGRSLDSLLHEVLVTEFLLSIELAIAARDDLMLLKRERRYFRRDRRLTYRSQRGTRHVEPDAGFLGAVERPDGTRNLLPMHFIELDNGTMPLRRLREKFEAYQQWASTEGEEYLRDETAGYGIAGTTNFRLLVIAHDKYDAGGDDRRLARIGEAVVELPRTMRDRIWLTPASSLGANRKESVGLDRAIWFRGRDLARAIAETSDRTTAELLQERATPIPRHALFPHDHTSAA